MTDFDGTLTTIRPDGGGQRTLVGGQSGATYGAGAGGADWQPLR